MVMQGHQVSSDIRHQMVNSPLLLLMVQKSGDRQLRLIVEQPIIYGPGFKHIQTVVGLGISEPSTVCPQRTPPQK